MLHDKIQLPSICKYIFIGSWQRFVCLFKCVICLQRIFIQGCFSRLPYSQNNYFSQYTNAIVNKVGLKQ